jgi:hypothetical protein
MILVRLLTVLLNCRFWLTTNSSIHIHGLPWVVHMYVCGACETANWLTTSMPCADKMLKEANIGLINGLFEAVYVNGEFIFIALV